MVDGSGPLTLELHYYRGRRPNFGDDLNAVLWPEILPADVWSSGDAVVVGIGSILTEPGLREVADAKKPVYVLGSGVSYGPAPRNVARWNVLAVRGPLSAAAIGLPDTAATDGAYLLADAPRLVGSPRARTDVVFIPHHRTLLDQPWAEVCAAAGLTYVSPESSVDQMLHHLAGARLVITEAMHGAIVADALRIPWIPVTVSPRIDEFKWRDWLSSVDLDYAPVAVPSPDPRTARRYRRLRTTMQRLEVDGHGRLAGSGASTDLTGWLERRYSSELLGQLHRAEVGTRAHRAVDKVVAGFPSSAFDDTVTVLQRAAESPPSLSDDRIFSARLDQLRDAVDSMNTSIMAG